MDQNALVICPGILRLVNLIQFDWYNFIVERFYICASNCVFTFEKLQLGAITNQIVYSTMILFLKTNELPSCFIAL